MSTPATIPAADLILACTISYHQRMRVSVGDLVTRRDERLEFRVTSIYDPMEHGIVLATILSPSGDVRAVSLDQLTQIPGSTRWSLRETLDACVTAAAQGADPVLASLSCVLLASHFGGCHGAEYANEEAYLWFLSMHVRCLDLAGHQAYGARQINERIAGSNVSFERRPPLLDAEVMASLSEARKRELIAHDFDRMTACGAESIRAAANDGERAFAEAVPGRLAFHRMTGQRMAVLASGAPKHDQVILIDLDSAEAGMFPVQVLDVSEDSVDALWMFSLLSENLNRNLEGFPHVMEWLSQTICGMGDDGIALIPDTSSQRTELGIYASLMYARASAVIGPAKTAKAMFKRAKELCRSLPKERQSFFFGMFPELVNPASFNTKAPGSILMAAFGPLCRQIEAYIESRYRALSGDDVPALDILAPLAAPTGPLPDVDIDRAAAPFIAPPEVAASPVASPTAAPVERPVPAAPSAQVLADRPAPRPKVQYEQGAQPLRFNHTEHLLLASEWELEDVEDAYALAVTAALEWLGRRLGTSLPTHWRDGAYEIERAGVTVQIESAPALFAFRLEHPDTAHPTRWWRVEATVLAGRDAHACMVGLRTRVRDLVDLPPPRVTVPGLVRAWCTAPGLKVAGAKAGSTVHVSQRQHLEQFGALARSPDREAPLWVLPIDAPRLPPSVTGLGRQVRIHEGALDDYGAAYGPFAPSTLHLYPPGDQRPQVIAIEGPDWAQGLCERSAAVRLKANSPTFRDVRDAIREARPASASAGTEPMQLGEESVPAPAVPAAPMSVADLQVPRAAEQRVFEELLEVAEGERDGYLTQLNVANHLLETAESDRAALRAQVELLQRALEQRRPGAVPATAAPVPETLDGLGDWSTSLSPRVLIADKALRAAAKVQHSEVPKICAALQALHDLYWPMKFESGPAANDASAAWRAFLQANRLTFSGVGSATSNSRYADEYKATVDGRTYMATMHVAGSSAHDPLRCLRIYTVCDEAARRIVVTHLPTHLTNSLT